MDEQSTTSQNPKGAQAFTIPQRYDVREHLYATRTSEAFRAAERSSGEQVILWVLRHPLAAHSEGPELFKSRMERLNALGITMPQIRSFGIDSSGKPFIATNLVQGSSFVDSTKNAPVAAKYFLEAARLVSVLHQSGLVLGDISEDSFLVDQNETVQLLALMGTFEVDAAKTALLPKSDTLNYLSPEQRGGSNPETYCDVYALGMLGYRLFAGRYPGLLNGAIDAAKSPAPSMMNNELPIWVDDVIGSCLVERRDGRYRDAGQICETIRRANESGLAPGGIGCWSKRTVMVRPDTVGKIRTSVGSTTTSVATRPDYDAAEPESLEISPAKVKKGVRRFLVLGSIGFAVGLIITTILFFLFSDPGSTSVELNQRWKELLASAPPDLQKLGSDFMAADSSIAQRSEALKRIAKSEEAVAFGLIIEAIKATPDVQLKVAAEKALLERIRRNGFEKSAAILANWFDQDHKAMRSPSDREGFDWLITACDTSRPLDKRRVDLSRAYTKQPVLALQLAAAISLDSKREEDFAPVLRQLLSVELDRDDIGTKSAASLVVMHRPLSLVFSQHLDELIKVLSPGELAWCMVELAKRNSLLVFKLAQETLNRKVVPPYQEVFLKALVSSGERGLPSQVRIALTNGARNNIGQSDVGALGRWYSSHAESPLLAICAISVDPEIALLAFDTLSARSVNEEPARSLMRWIKNERWAERAKLVKAVGILGHADIASLDEVNFAFDQLMPHAGLSLVDYIMKSKDVNLLKVALERFAELAPNHLLLSLLKHKDADIRISAVRGLQGRNNLNVLQTVLQEYQREEDPRVKKMYKKYHFVVRDRENR